MEWVETTAKSVDEAKEAALDQLGVAADEAEFEVVEEPKSGLFGMTRGTARVRARVRPATVRPKQDRRRGRSGGRGGKGGGRSNGADRDEQRAETAPAEREPSAEGDADRDGDGDRDGGGASSSRGGRSSSGSSQRDGRGSGRSGRSEGRSERREQSDVAPEDVRAAAQTFVDGLVEAFGVQGDVTTTVDELEIDVAVSGDDLGLLIGSGGRTLTAIQDITRVAAQRRLGDHDTRLRVDVAGYRERRSAALERFARTVAEQVAASGASKAMEPMGSADRKVIHDVIAGIDGVTSRSEGDDPDRRVVVSPA